MANAGCWLLKKPLELAVTIAIKIVDKSKVFVDIAKGALSIAQGIVRGARGVLSGAIGFLEVMRRTYRIGVNALSALANFVLTQIINIREVYFKVGLSAASGGRFQCRVKGVLMGKNINLSLYFDTRNIWSLAKNLGERAISGTSKFFE